MRPWRDKRKPLLEIHVLYKEAERNLTDLGNAMGRDEITLEYTQNL